MPHRINVTHAVVAIGCVDATTAIAISAGGFNSFEGFSQMGPLLAHFPSISLEASNLPRLWSITASSPNVVVFDAQTSTAIPVWTEVRRGLS